VLELARENDVETPEVRSEGKSGVPDPTVFGFRMAISYREYFAQDPNFDIVEYDRQLVGVYGFKAFVEIAWREADASIFEPAPHITAIAEELEEVVRKRHAGEGSDTGIALPPGASKSMIVSVLLQPWTWIWWPESAWITATYDDGLSHRLSSKARGLVESKWYQDRWPLELAKTSEKFWSNAKGGKRIAVGIGSRITGEHAHIVILDDPVKEQLTRIGTPAQISAAVGKAVDYWFGTLSTRVIDYTAARILIHQRLHVDDPIGVAEREHGYRVICLPARFDPAREDLLDHRDVEGELLCSRLTEDALQDLEIRLGPRASAAQLDQAPVPLGGYLLLDTYLANRYKILPGDLIRAIEEEKPGIEERWITAWDLTFKGKPTSDYVVGQVWCLYHGRDYLVDQVRGQMGYLATKQAIRDLAARYPFITTHIIEDAANAAAIDEDLGNEIPGLQLVSHGGGVLARTQQVEGIWASGAVWIPESAPWVGGADGFVAEHLSFDGLGTRHDDQVSASSLALTYLHQGQGSRWAECMKAASKDL
jgi:predicted phage terminase large subunit-like protein